MASAKLFGGGKNNAARKHMRTQQMAGRILARKAPRTLTRRSGRS